MVCSFYDWLRLCKPFSDFTVSPPISLFYGSIGRCMSIFYSPTLLFRIEFKIKPIMNSLLWFHVTRLHPAHLFRSVSIFAEWSYLRLSTDRVRSYFMRSYWLFRTFEQKTMPSNQVITCFSLQTPPRADDVISFWSLWGFMHATWRVQENLANARLRTWAPTRTIYGNNFFNASRKTWRMHAFAHGHPRSPAYMVITL